MNRSITMSKRILSTNILPMKNILNGTARAFAVAALLTVGFGIANDAAAGAIKVEVWQFNSGNAALPAELATNTTPQGTAVVTPGNFASGWLEQNPLFGSATGVWDLGQNGTIDCSGLASLIGGPGQERTVTIKVKQYNDGAMYADYATVFVPSATLQSSKVTAAGSGTLGAWYVEETRWKVSAAATVDAVTILGADYGTLVDQVSVEAAALVVLPQPKLSIRALATGEIEVSWPSAYNTMLLEASGDAADSQGWTPVSAPVQTSGEVSSVILEKQPGAKFYRLRQP